MDIYFYLLGHGVIAYRYSELIPSVKDKITFENMETTDYIVIYRRLVYKEDKIAVHVFMQEDKQK